MVKGLDGTEMARISATFKTHLKKREEASIILSHFKFSLDMMMMRFIQLIAILILILIVMNFYKDYVLQKVKIESEKQLFVKISQEMIVRWQLLPTLLADRKKSPSAELL